MENNFCYLQNLFLTQFNESIEIDENVLNNFKKSNFSTSCCSSFFWLLNYSKYEPEFVSDFVNHVIGYNKSYFSNSSINNFFNLVPEGDKKLLKKVFQKIFDFYQEIPLQEKQKYRFDFNYRVQRADDRLIPVLHQLTFIQSSSLGFPSIELSLITDFSTYKNNSIVELEIFKLENGVFNTVGTWEYNDYIDNLTNREKEIIKLIFLGFTDREISEKAFISIHTVKTHRKNIVLKTNSRNTAEALTKCFSVLPITFK